MRVKAIEENVGMHVCDFCGQEKECIYMFFPPDVGECYICNECDIECEKQSDIIQDRYDRKVIGMVNEFNKLHEGIKHKSKEWLGFASVITLIRYNELDKSLKNLGFRKNNEGLYET